ncbi:MAG: O-antigen ligase family protein [Oscillospiraceae bacterium]|nr:O-antigen ligase family protein [Oscillospiraceae bacterium]
MTILLYAIVFFLLSNYGSFGKRHIVIIAVVTIIMCVVTVVQLCGINIFGLYPAFNGKITKYVSTVGNMDMFSGILCIFIPIVVTAYLVLDNSKIANIALLTAQVLSIYTVLELGVSSGKLALFVTMLILLPFMFRDEKRLFKLADFLAVLTFALLLHRFVEYKYIKALEKTQIQIVFDGVSGALLLLGAALMAIRWGLHRLYTRKKLTLSALRGITIGEIVIPALLIVAISFSLIPIGAETEFGKLNLDIIGGATLEEEIVDLFAGKLTDASGTYRIGIWRNALQMGLKRPIFGTGIGTFLEAFKTYADKAGLTERLGLIDTAHNEYLQLFCTVGLFGLMPYLAFLILLAVKGFKNIFKNPYILILGAAVLCYCVQAFFSFSVVIVAPYFWMSAGLLYKEIKKEESHYEKQQ